MVRAPTPEGAPSRELQRWELPEVDGIPYFDEDLQLPQGLPHQDTVMYVGPALKAVARRAGLLFLSDNPIWYLSPETQEQKVFYGDVVLARPMDASRIVATDLLLVIEVVSRLTVRKEVKDTVFQRALNEFNGVPEFGLVFPDLDDGRTLVWHRLDPETQRYRELTISPGGSIASETVPGLELSVRPKERWEEGRKIDVTYLGEAYLSLDEEKVRADEEKARADRLAAQLRALGIDPDA